MGGRPQLPRYVPTSSIGSYIANIKNAGEAKRLETYNQIANYRSTLPRERRFSEGHFPDAPDGHAAMWWFLLSKKFTADSYADRLPRIASHLAARAQIEADPDEATRLLLHAHLLTLEDPKSRHTLSQFFTHLGLAGEAAKSNRILHALWSPPRDGFAPATLFPVVTPESSNNATNTLRAQREWLQHFTARTFRPLTEPPPEAA